MIQNNPQIYKIATKQLATLRKLALMSVDTFDREGAEIIQRAEVAIEQRIMITRINLNALEYLNHLIEQGHDYADAEWRTTQCYPIDRKKLRASYDNQFQSN